ncbi:sulfatase [Acanthopleuribacter pedis]|uniref:Sulfatase n=1 Tax=Acanthopleuribacter pedis TaxID=442870 RepID=A0A8J7Q6M2_9BACT|nr:sulfatase [Acanthopleuribacter pedis]MBO1321502.1 sulfatase [Acanthopleuribacter pedis]
MRYCVVFLLFCVLPHAFSQSAQQPNIVLISVDTLRADHLSAYGYPRKTSPHIDQLLAAGRRFDQAYTVEPLTAPACTSMLTGRYPHEHGATRNGVPMLTNLISLPKLLEKKGYDTAAFVSNWTLRTSLVGLAEHFQHYGEVFTRKRWFGLMMGEATGEDITDQGLAWISDRKKPFFLWLHYSEPHAPYRFQATFAQAWGLKNREAATRIDRYDSEIAFCDAQIGRFLAGLTPVSAPENTLILFVADHGECLGENQYWGHGRHLYEGNLRIPMGITWAGRIPAGVATEPASLIDLPRTVLGLLAYPQPDHLAGFDWTAVLLGKGTADASRALYFQAHKGAVQSQKAAERGRRRGLLEVGRLQNHIKESWRVRSKKIRRFNLAEDPREQTNLADARAKLQPETAAWALEVEQGLQQVNEQELIMSQEDLEMMRSLGYID